MANVTRFFVAFWLVAGLHLGEAFADEQPIRVAIVGLVHGHVNGFLRRHDPSLVEIVGICEPDEQVTAKYRERYGLDQALFVADLSRLLDTASPEAVWVFTATSEHLAVVEACAPRGIHVIVEKPLATRLADAKRMAALSREHGTHVLTNLETSWYDSLHEVHELAAEREALGPLTKIVSHFGHRGPKEIGVPLEFLDWLTDPERNGGGASADFGCYGANLTTWLMGNDRPLAVTAVFQTNKPEIYGAVDDVATIIIEYPKAQAIVQASWDWPFPRKDVHLYGRSGFIRTLDAKHYEIRTEQRQSPIAKTAKPLPSTRASSLGYFAAVVRGTLDPALGLSSLENNLVATEILDAARLSAKRGERVVLDPR